MLLKFTISFVCLLSAACLYGQLTFERMGNFSISQPVEISSTGIANDDRLFVCQKNGSIRIIDNINGSTPTLRTAPFLSLNVNDNGEGGLLGLVFDPDFATNGWFYINYTANEGGQMKTFVVRYSVNDPSDNVANTSPLDTIIKVVQPRDNHNGGDIDFSGGFLFIGLGDGGGGGDPFENSQDSSVLLGKMLRMNVDTIPAIPAGCALCLTDTNIPDEIWSFGWRNPWRFSVDPVTGLLYVGDVGQGAREEISVESPTIGGRNYGWDCYEGNRKFESLGCADSSLYTYPLHEYTHSLGQSVTGGVVYRGSQFPELLGKYIFTDYTSSGNFMILTLGAGGTTVLKVDTISNFLDGLSRVSVIGTDNEGEIYAAELFSGEIHHVMSSSILPVELLSFSGQAQSDHNLLQWKSASESHFDYYSIEKLQEGGFSEIGHVLGENAALGADYSFRDFDYKNSEETYRLKLVDLDGSYTLSDEIMIYREAPTLDFSVYPVPSDELIYLKNIPTGTTTIRIINGSGQVVFVSSQLEELTSISVKDFPPGPYSLILYTSEKQISKPIVVAH